MNWIKEYDIISTNKSVILKAIQLPFRDKEDACQYYTALYNNIDYFVSRNKKDYERYASVLAIYTPLEYLEIYNCEC
ncbi:MAG: hypothetical protein AAF600_00985 [Bacteroidota bacterium]